MKNILSISSGVMQQYKLAKNWKSDLDYLLKESKFLHHLFDGYYLNFSSEYYLKTLMAIECALRLLDQDIKDISGVLEVQLGVFDRLASGDGKYDSSCRADLVKVEKEINEVHQKFRALKERLFQFVEDTEDRNETLSFLDKFE